MLKNKNEKKGDGKMRVTELSVILSSIYFASYLVIKKDKKTG